MAGAGAPLMRLKDLLELDCESCSAAGFRCYPRRLGESSPVRHLLESSEAALRIGRSPSLRCPSKLSHLSRTLSRRLRGSFWWRRGEEAAADEAAVHGCACGSEPDTSPSSEYSHSSGRTSRSRSVTDSDFLTASSASESMHAATRGEHEEEMKKRGANQEGSSWGSEVDDKEQLSPVAVMDFPCFDDEGAACSPSSDDSLLSRLPGRKTHKIRRFGSLDELGPVDLDARLAASLGPDDDHTEQQLRCHADETAPRRPSSSSSSRCVAAEVHHERDENGLLVLIADTVSAAVDAVSQRLLLDFFAEMKVGRRWERAPAGPLPGMAERLGDCEILAAARGWLSDGEGTERWGLKDVLRGGETVVAEMERGRRWMQVAEEEREVGAMVARMLTDQLVNEVVRDLSV